MPEPDLEWERRKPAAWAPSRFRDTHPVGSTYPPEESYSADFHDQVVVVAWDGTPIGVDEGMAPLLTDLWRRGYRTYVSCQGDAAGIVTGQPGTWAYIDFETPGMAQRFTSEFDVSQHRMEHALVRFPAAVLGVILDSI